MGLVQTQTQQTKLKDTYGTYKDTCETYKDTYGTSPNANTANETKP